MHPIFARFRLVAILFVALPAWSTAFAQRDQPEQRLVLSLVGGVSSATADVGPVIGGTLTYDLTQVWSLEGRGIYLDRGIDANALDLNVGLRRNVLSTTETSRLATYVAGGVGLYRATFHLRTRRFPDSPSSSGANPYCVDANGGPAAACAAGVLPRFYWHELTDHRPRDEVIPERVAFMDPAVNVGGGLRVNVHGRLSVRTDARAIVVTHRSDTLTVGVFTITMGYRF